MRGTHPPDLPGLSENAQGQACSLCEASQVDALRPIGLGRAPGDIPLRLCHANYLHNPGDTEPTAET
jgi:hypothetical protein